jgi:hypothetical protein
MDLRVVLVRRSRSRAGSSRSRRLRSPRRYANGLPLGTGRFRCKVWSPIGGEIWAGIRAREGDYGQYGILMEYGCERSFEGLVSFRISYLFALASDSGSFSDKLISSHTVAVSTNCLLLRFSPIVVLAFWALISRKSEFFEHICWIEKFRIFCKFRFG